MQCVQELGIFESIFLGSAVVMLTATIQISNSDNRLSQADWSHFCQAIQQLLESVSEKVHFEGGSRWDAPYQNACWVCSIDDARERSLRQSLSECRSKFKQDSVAFTIGKPEFI